MPLEKLDYRDTSIVAFPEEEGKNSLMSDEQLKQLPAKANRKDASNFTKARDIMNPALLSVGWFESSGLELQFENLGKVLIDEAGPLVGKTLKYFADDSFEDGFRNWTDKILQRFEEYRGYNASPYLPVLSGYMIGSAEISDRFLHDYRKTVNTDLRFPYQVNEAAHGPWPFSTPR